MSNKLAPCPACKRPTDPALPKCAHCEASIYDPKHGRSWPCSRNTCKAIVLASWSKCPVCGQPVASPEANRAVTIGCLAFLGLPVLAMVASDIAGEYKDEPRKPAVSMEPSRDGVSDPELKRLIDEFNKMPLPPHPLEEQAAAGLSPLAAWQQACAEASKVLGKHRRPRFPQPPGEVSLKHVVLPDGFLNTCRVVGWAIVDMPDGSRGHQRWAVVFERGADGAWKPGPAELL